MPTDIKFPYIDDQLVDDEVYVLSTIGQGPKGEKGDKGDVIYPKFAEPVQWSQGRSYDANTVVLGPNGNSYISKITVPSGISITNGYYWALTNDYNAQMEQCYLAAQNAVDVAVSTANRVRSLYTDQDTLIVFSKVSQFIDPTNTAGGLCALIVSDETYTLYDTGAMHSYYYVNEMLSDYLGNKKLTNVIISHYDTDHIENIELIVDNFCDSNTVFYLPLPPGNTSQVWYQTIRDNFELVVTKIGSNKIVYPNNNDSITAGYASLVFNNCGSSYISWYDDNSTDYNNYSMCTYVINGDEKFLLAGDIGVSAQNHMIDMGDISKVDGLLIPHHGTNPNDSTDFYIITDADFGVTSNSIKAYDIESISRYNNGVSGKFFSSHLRNVFSSGTDYVVYVSHFGTHNVVGIPLSTIGPYYNGVYYGDYTKITINIDSNDDSVDNKFKSLGSALNYVNTYKATSNIYINSGYTQDGNQVRRYTIPPHSRIIGNSAVLGECYLFSSHDVVIEDVVFNKVCHVEEGSITFKNCTFNETSAQGITALRANVYCEGCTFKDNDIAVYASTNSKVTLENCTFNNCDYLFRCISSAHICVRNDKNHKPKYNIDAYSSMNNYGKIELATQDAYPRLLNNKALSSYSVYGIYYSDVFSSLVGINDLPSGLGGAFVLENYMKGGATYQKITTVTINSSANNGIWLRQGSNSWFKII